MKKIIMTLAVVLLISGCGVPVASLENIQKKYPNAEVVMSKAFSESKPVSVWIAKIQTNELHIIRCSVFGDIFEDEVVVFK